MGDWEKPYRKVLQREEQLEQETLIQQYKDLYKKKYRQDVIFHPSNVHFKHLKELRQQVGDKASHYLYAFFEIREDWFMKQNHSLKCLLDNINKVAIHVEKSFQKKIELKEKRLVNHFCEACFKDLKLEVAMDFSFDDGKVIRCEDCLKSNKPLKKVDKASAIVLKMPEVPK